VTEQFSKKATTVSSAEANQRNRNAQLKEGWVDEWLRVLSNITRHDARSRLAAAGERLASYCSCRFP
jgi:hypothetical protein